MFARSACAQSVYVLARTYSVYDGCARPYPYTHNKGEMVCTSLPVHIYIYSKGEMKNVYVFTRAPLVYETVCTSLLVHT